jgi:hypothetical protein
MHTSLTIQYDPRSAQYLVMAPDGTVLKRCDQLRDADTAVAQFAFLAAFAPQRRLAS